MSIPDDSETQYQTFRDCVFSAITQSCLSQGKTQSRRRRSTRKSSVPKRKPCSLAEDPEPAPAGEPATRSSESLDLDDPSSLADFSDYLASDIFLSLPASLRTLTYPSFQSSSSLLSTYSLPLSYTLVENISSHLQPSILDTLTSYSLISPPSSDTASFLTPILSSYITALTTTPPPPSTTRPESNECELCSRTHLPLTYHHLIPRSTHAKVLKRAWRHESALNNVAWLCRACHSFVHSMASNEELAREWFSVERIREREDVRRWVGWVGGVRWKKR